MPEFHPISEDDQDFQLIFFAEDEYGKIEYATAAPDLETPNGHVGEFIMYWAICGAIIAMIAAATNLAWGFGLLLVVGIVWSKTVPTNTEVV